MAEKTTPPDNSAKPYQPPKAPRPHAAKPGAAKPNSAKPAEAASTAPEGDRIAKVLSRAGIASRREAERLIEIGEVAVNGKVITSPALNVTARDKITVGGKPVAAAEPARLWLYYKPEGLVTSESDEKGRATVFDNLPPELPRVMSVGRLDLNSEGLLLLTNDGELKRRLELPSTGWLRKYRVRINGNPTDPDLEPLRKGIVVDGERFQPMSVVLDRIQGANAWLTIGLREGKNREIRRALNALDLYVNRLIRVSYGPFRLGDLTEGQVEEVKPRVLRDQLGLDPMAEEEVPQKPSPKGAPRGPGGVPRSVSHGPVRGKPRPEGRDAEAPKPRGDKPFADGKPFAAKPYAAKPGPKGAPRGEGPKSDGPRPARPRRPG